MRKWTSVEFIKEIKKQKENFCQYKIEENYCIENV